MSNVKYIAEGFLEDAGRLLQEFIDQDSVEFSIFAHIWKNHYFSLIFMGRPDHVENTEFTNEVFRISSQFLGSPQFYRKVGAVYLLYALFRNQISNPCIKIRIEINHWRIIKSLHMDAALNNFRTLHYIIQYLIKHAFLYVAHQMLKGPVIANLQKVSKYQEIVSTLKASYKSDIMEYSNCNNLQKIRDLYVEYAKEKQNVGMIGINIDDMKATSKSYEKILQELRDIVLPSTAKQLESLGCRRAKLKAQSFQRKTLGRFGRTSEDEEDEGSEFEQEEEKKYIVKKKKVYRARRVRKEDRRVGRPSKKKKETVEPVSDDDLYNLEKLDISHLLSQQEEFYLPPAEAHCKKPRTRRDPYYKLSPKREEQDSSD